MRSRGSLLLLTRLVSCGASMVQADPGNTVLAWLLAKSCSCVDTKAKSRRVIVNESFKTHGA